MVSLHWLRVSEIVVYTIAVLTFKVLHWDFIELSRAADLPGRQAFRSAGSRPQLRIYCIQ